MVKKILLSSSALVITLVFTSGAAFASSISNTGKGSFNLIANANVQLCSSKNYNNVGVNNYTVQQSATGNAKVTKNTTGGNAKTGAASNSNTTNLTVAVANTNPCNTLPLGGPDTSNASINTTGKGSVNVVGSLNLTSTTTVNDNDLWVGNATLQGSASGNATVSNNTTGGSATSGNSSNTNSTTLTVSVTNN